MRPSANRRPAPLVPGRFRFAVLLAALLVPAALQAAADVNGNGAALYANTLDYWSGTATPNTHGASLVSIGTQDGGGVLPMNTNGASLTINPLNRLTETGMGPVAADFSATPLSGSAPLEVQFTDLSTTGLHGIDSWSWTFGDGGASAAQNPVHIYDTPGTYTVSLTITTVSGVGGETKEGYITVDSVVPAHGGLALLLLAGVLAVAGGRICRQKG